MYLMAKAWGRILNLLGFGIWVFDFTTDALTLPVYWTEQSRTVAVIASVLLGLSGLTGIFLIPRTLFAVFEGLDYEDAILVCLRCIQASLMSIPQLCLNLYVISSCNQSIRLIQYISALASLIAACGGVVSFDEIFAKKVIEDDILWKDWLERALLFTTKVIALMARVLLLTYYLFFMGWWTAMAIVAHFLILALAIMTTIISEGAVLDLSSSIAVATFVIVLLLWFTFVWSLDQRLGKTSGFLLAVFYSMENLYLLIVALDSGLIQGPYCLYDSELAVNVSINVACMAFAFIYVWKRRRGNETVEKITKRIGVAAKSITQNIGNSPQTQSSSQIHSAPSENVESGHIATET